MARAALKLTLREVESLTGVNKDTISRYESGKEILASALQALEKLFRDEGIVFLDQDASGGVGIRLPSRVPAKRSTKNGGKPSSLSGARKAK
jgi:transcriptional regulator with XRE-family HTH domain